MQTHARHFPGNNYETLRQRRVDVTVAVGTNANQARWYFPDIPDLTNKQIVGIEANCATGTGESELDGDLAYNTNPPNGPDYWNGNQARYCFVNLASTKKEQLYSQFPAYMFFNAQDSGSTWGTKTGKIMPVFAKLILRECYIYVPNSTIFPVGTADDFTASFTFFHR